MIWESRGFRDLALALGMTVTDLKVIEFKNGLEKFPDKDLVEEASDLGLLDGGEDDS